MYVVVFDFALAGLLLFIFGFFVWCWIGFHQASKSQAGYHPESRLHPDPK